MRKLTYIVDWLVIILFVGIICVPFVLSLVKEDSQISENEKRPLASFPEMNTVQSWKKFTENFDIYYQDHFGLREWMIHRYQRETSKRFGEPGMPFAIEGKDGWFFYAREGTLEDLQGQLRFSENEIKRFCQGLEAKHRWFANRNILYIPFVAPNKQSIYEHKLKDSYRVLKGTETRFDQVLTACNSDSNTFLYDIRPELKRQGTRERGYAKTDTHWNDRGAMVAYIHLMNLIKESLPKFSFKEKFLFLDNFSEAEGGDLTVLLGREKFFTEYWPILNVNRLGGRTGVLIPELKNLISLPQLEAVVYLGNPSAGRLLVLHDSFFNTLKIPVAINFSKSLYVWQFRDNKTMEMSNPKVLSEIITSFYPDVVMEEIVERHLEWLLESVDYNWSDVQ